MATRVQELEARLQYQKDENVAVRKDLEERFVRQEEDIKATLELEKKCVAQLEADLVASRTAATGIQERLEEALTEVARLEGKLQASSDVPQRLQGELDTLRTSLKNVETTNAELADRARTIESRYKAGDLVRHG